MGALKNQLIEEMENERIARDEERELYGDPSYQEWLAGMESVEDERHARTPTLSRSAARARDERHLFPLSLEDAAVLGAVK